MTGQAHASLPIASWAELRDALYLAAWQDAAVPYPYRDWQPGGRELSLPSVLADEDSGGSGRPDESEQETGTDSPGTSMPGEPEDSEEPGKESEPAGSEEPERTGEPEVEEGKENPCRTTTRSDAVPKLATVPARNPNPIGVPQAELPAQGADPASGWPATPPFPDSLALSRRLRPLRLRRAAPDARVLDEEATAERAAGDGLWLPVLRPVEERLLELVLLVDAHPSLALWQETVRRFGRLLERTAAFRTVSTSPLDLGGPPSPRWDASVSDRLVLVVTDGISDAWRNGEATAQLHAMARTSPTAVLSLLPQELWEFTLPHAVKARLTAPSPAAPNRLITMRRKANPLAWLDGISAEDAADAVPVPVLELTAGSLGRWAQLVASPGGSHDAAVLVTDARVPSTTAAQREDPSDRPPAERAPETVGRFLAQASPAAFALARRLAAVPLNLPVMHLVQEAVPETAVWNLAELMLFGLLWRTDHGVNADDPRQVSFDFADGVREELLGLGTRAETVGVLRRVATCLGPLLAASVPDGEALVAWEADAADPPVDDRTLPFVRPMHAALSALSGPYLPRATRLGKLLREVPDKAPPPLPPARRTTQGHRSDTLGASPSPPPGAVLPRQEKPPQTALGGSVATASQSVRSIEQAKATAPPAPRRVGANVPLRNRNFTGREEILDQLHQRLASGVTTAVLPEALHGMGGVGKSQIAIEYVYRNSQDYQLVWWIPSEQTTLIVQSLIELGEQMGLRAGADRSAVAAVLEALRVGKPYANWLLIFDNAENPQEVRKFFPNDGPGRVMVTSRNSQWSTLASSLEVDVFTRTESLALIKRRSPQIPDEAANRLADSLGDLPLAVEQAAVWLAETGMPAQQYLDLFETKCAELLEVAPPADYDLPVAAAWNVSLDRLREDHPAALQLLQVCAFFAPEPIDRNFFSAVRGVTAPLALRAALDDPIKLSRAVREIGRYALARIDHRNATIQVHRLVQRVLIEQMNSQERAEMRHCAHQILTNADPRNPHRPAEWPRYSALLPHVRATGMMECEDPWVRQLVLNEARFLIARSDYTEALDLAEQAAGTWQRLLGDDHEHVIQADQARAEALRWLNRHSDAYELQSKLVERCRRVLGERSEITQRALSVLAILLRLRGDFHRARELDRRAYETTLQEFDADDPGTLQAAHNYAVSLRLAGAIEEARELDEDTHQRLVQVLGDDHSQTLNSLHSLYIDFQELGRYRSALEGQEKLMERAQRLLGEEHSLTVWVARELSVTRRKLGDHEGALNLSRQVLEMLRAKRGDASLDTVRAALNHATDLRQTGSLPAAAELGRQTMDQCRLLLGDEHPHVYATATNLAVTLRLLGRVEEAHALDHAAVDGLSRVLSPSHPRTLLVRTNLASDHFEAGAHQAACAMDTETLEHSVRDRGEDHPATLALRLNLSYDLRALGEIAKAEELHDRALVTFRTVHGPQHPATLDAVAFKRANCDIDLLSV